MDVIFGTPVTEKDGSRVHGPRSSRLWSERPGRRGIPYSGTGTNSPVQNPRGIRTVVILFVS